MPDGVHGPGAMSREEKQPLEDVLNGAIMFYIHSKNENHLSSAL